MTIKKAVELAADMALDLWQLEKPLLVTAARKVEPHWERPPSGWLKCNTDGAFYEEQWQGATGAVIRDDNGAFFRGGAKWYANNLDALTMEAPCQDGLLLSRQANA
jgi:hypothetical protein